MCSPFLGPVVKGVQNYRYRAAKSVKILVRINNQLKNVSIVCQMATSGLWSDVKLLSFDLRAIQFEYCQVRGQAQSQIRF
jgi:hypothetical protein